MTNPRRAKAIMVLGTTSNAGKSWLTTALCRYYARHPAISEKDLLGLQIPKIAVAA